MNNRLSISENFIIQPEIAIRWNYKTSKHYKNLGYSFTNWGDSFLIRTNDLSENSSERVTGYCPICNAASVKDYCHWQRRGTTLCQLHTIKNLVGLKFGKLKVSSYGERKKDGYYWDCICECGRRISVSGKNLTRKSGTTACGKCNYEDIKGQRFNKLTAVKHIGGGKWECVCDCGNAISQNVYSLKASAYSCGKGKCNTSSVFRSGKNSPTWNPNLTDNDRTDRRIDPEYQKWAKAIKDRDSYTCQSCKRKSSGNLVSHHLNSYSFYPALRYDTDNGIALCVSCHKAFHSWMGGNRVVCTKQDYKNWLNN